MLLDLRDRGIGAEQLGSLLSALPSDLLELRLDGNPLEDAGLELLCEALSRVRLRRLSLQRVSASDEALGRFAACDDCSGLTELNVAENDLGTQGLAAFCQSPWFWRLQRLDLSANFFCDEGVAILTEGERPAQWNVLGLGNVGLSDEGLVRLAGSRVIENLTALDLGNYSEYPNQNVLTDAGLAALAASNRCVHLACLDLTETAVGAAGTSLLLQSARLPRLERVKLSGCWKIDADVRRDLQAQFGGRVEF